MWPRRHPRLDQLLSECLDRLAQGATVQDCLAACPERAGELRPLIETALAVRAASGVQPTPKAKAAGLARLRQAMAAAPVAATARPLALDDVLTDCLDRMSRGASVDDCLAAYPVRAAELRPLLQTARVVGPAARVRPRAEAKAAARERLRHAMARHPPQAWRAAIFQQHLRAWASAAAALVIVVGGYGVVEASSDSKPNELLYPIKRTVERVRLAWPLRSDESRGRLSEELARRRAEELAEIAVQSPPKRLAALSGRVAENIDRAVAISLEQTDRDERRLSQQLDASAGLERPESVQRAHALNEAVEQRLRLTKERLERDAETHRQRLEQVLAHAPQERKEQVRKAIQQVNEPYRQALQQIDTRLDQIRQTEPVEERIRRRREQIAATAEARPPTPVQPGVSSERTPIARPHGTRVPPTRPEGRRSAPSAAHS